MLWLGMGDHNVCLVIRDDISPEERWKGWIGQARHGWPGWTARPYVTGFTAITLTEVPGCAIGQHWAAGRS